MRNAFAPFSAAFMNLSTNVQLPRLMRTILFERSGVPSGKGEQASEVAVVSLEVAYSSLVPFTASGSAWKYVCTKVNGILLDEKLILTTGSCVMPDTVAFCAGSSMLHGETSQIASLSIARTLTYRH